jgi:FMN phosphatase YigB (HAD superfamily)
MRSRRANVCPDIKNKIEVNMSARESISPIPRAFLFDAYGTLFDVYAVARPILAGLDCDARIFAQMWRQKQVEYTWLRTLMARYEDFWKITERALLATARQLSVQLTQERTMAADGSVSLYACLRGCGGGA